MPKLQLLTSNETLLNALKFDRSATSLSYKTLQEENYSMGKIIEVIMKKERGSVSFTHAEDTSNSGKPNINSSTYFQQSYQVERTITQYKGDHGVDTKVDPKSGIEYPYDKIVKFVSNFPSCFRGFFVCGREDHYCRSDSPQITWSRDDYEKTRNLF